MTKLEKRWAWFFVMNGWRWTYHPVCEYFLRPTFRVSFRCEHSECNGSHTLDVFLMDVDHEKDFGLTVYDLAGARPQTDVCGAYVEPHPALFGSNPSVTTWEMAHGAGGGMECVPNWAPDWRGDWASAGYLARTKLPIRHRRCA